MYARIINIIKNIHSLSSKALLLAFLIVYITAVDVLIGILLAEQGRVVVLMLLKVNKQ